MTTRYAMIFALLLLLAASIAGPVHAQTELEPGIVSPEAGQVLQGIVEIKGSNHVDGFSGYMVDFTYMENPTETWFQLYIGKHPVDGGLLAKWDTTGITDGNYTLRMRVFLKNGRVNEFRVENLRIRNYTVIETPTPLPTPLQPTTAPTITITPTPFPTPTQMPTNYASITSNDISRNLSYGGIFALGGFLVLGVYLWIRRK